MLIPLAIASLNACGDDAVEPGPPASDVEFINLRVDDIGATSAMVRFDTSLPTTCELSFDGMEAVMGPYETPDPEQLYVFTFSEPVTGQRVRFEAVTTTGGNTGAKEIQFLTPASG